jgi:hypothetical protein
VQASEVKGSRKGSPYAFAKDARAVQVSPDPAHYLQTKITYRVLPQFLLEDHVLDALPWFEETAPPQLRRRRPHKTSMPLLRELIWLVLCTEGRMRNPAAGIFGQVRLPEGDRLLSSVCLSTELSISNLIVALPATGAEFQQVMPRDLEAYGQPVT